MGIERVFIPLSPEQAEALDIIVKNMPVSPTRTRAAVLSYHFYGEDGKVGEVPYSEVRRDITFGEGVDVGRYSGAVKIRAVYDAIQPPKKINTPERREYV